LRRLIPKAAAALRRTKEATHRQDNPFAFGLSLFARLIADDGFINVLPGLILEGSPATRAPIVLERLKKIAALSVDT